MMNWTAILARAGIPESPGRSAAIDAALAVTAARKAAAEAERIAKRNKQPSTINQQTET
jgi:hypothetical protein